MVIGRVFDVQRFSLHNGPGIRTTVFLKGCPLACAWCHNPEGRSPEREVVRIEGRCLACGACGEVCATGAAREAAPSALCVRCGRCVEACPTAAREFVGRDVTADDFAEEASRDRVFFEESGGGVTFSGGEPLAQPEFLLAALERLRASGIRTAVDTCGHAPRDLLLRVAATTDLVLFDLKLIDSERHLRLTGVPNDTILGNFRALGRAHANLWVRVPVIPGVNDDDGNLAATARLTAATPGVRCVDLLPYHRTGLGKFARSGMRNDLGHVQPPTPEHMERLAEPFRRLALETTVGGR
jgi:pyruvate formate lyase activating enzyme